MTGDSRNSVYCLLLEQLAFGVRNTDRIRKFLVSSSHYVLCFITGLSLVVSVRSSSVRSDQYQ